MNNPRIVAEGLRFPEGPAALADGSVLVVEIEGRTLARVTPDGNVERVAELGGGPNGAALGPDGKVYIANNGGFAFTAVGTMLLPFGEPGGFNQPDDYVGGSIQRVDLDTGAVETVYTECDGIPLKGPNDLVFDADGGLWFTDHGKTRVRERDRTGVFYARADGSSITEVLFPVADSNGIGLSPDGARLYVAETFTARVWAWDVTGPGQVARSSPVPPGGHLLAGLGGLHYLDSMAIDGEGNVCVATIANPGITVISPDGSTVEHLPIPAEVYDPVPTNICFGGDDLRTAYITLSATGRLLAVDWPRPGLKLNWS